MPGRWGCLNPIDAWGRLDIDPDYGKEPKAPKVYCPRNPDMIQDDYGTWTYNGESDALVVTNENGFATGMILIPNDAEVSMDEFDKKLNIHFTMFKFWDGLNCMVQHCLYEIDYNNFQVRSFIKDNNFDWITSSIQKLSFYEA